MSLKALSTVTVATRLFVAQSTTHTGRAYLDAQYNLLPLVLLHRNWGVPGKVSLAVFWRVAASTASSPSSPPT